MRQSRLGVILATIVTISLAFATGAAIGCSQLPWAQAANKEAPASLLKQKYLYDALVFEIAPLTSCSPDPAALDHFRSSLERFSICRAEAVVFLVRDEIKVEDWVFFALPYWTYGSIGEFESFHRRCYDYDPYDRVGIIFVPYVAGPVLRREGVSYLGGLQYSESSFAVWKDGSEFREAEVLLHELAHLIGIKEYATEPRYHCSDKSCVMWTTATPSSALFCKNCRQELSELIEEQWEE